MSVRESLTRCKEQWLIIAWLSAVGGIKHPSQSNIKDASLLEMEAPLDLDNRCFLCQYVTEIQASYQDRGIDTPEDCCGAFCPLKGLWSDNPKYNETCMEGDSNTPDTYYRLWCKHLDSDSAMKVVAACDRALEALGK